MLNNFLVHVIGAALKENVYITNYLSLMLLTCVCVCFSKKKKKMLLTTLLQINFYLVKNFYILLSFQISLIWGN